MRLSGCLISKYTAWAHDLDDISITVAITFMHFKHNCSISQTHKLALMVCPLVLFISFQAGIQIHIRASVNTLYRDGTSEISCGPCTKVAENDSFGLQNTLEIVYGLISIYTYAQILRTCLQFSTRELAHMLFHDCCVIVIFFFFFKPTISLLEQVQELIFPYASPDYTKVYMHTK